METRSGRAVCPPGWHHEYDIEDQQAASVKHSMSGHLGHFRSSLEKFKKAVCQQKSVAMVEYCLNDVQEAYKSLSQAHDVYVSLEVDPSRLQLSQSQLRDASEQLEAARVACGAYQLEPSTSTPAALDQNRRPFSDISPSDSVSQSGSGSRTSRASQSSSAMRAKAAARKAALLARSKFVAQRQKLELKELQVKQEMDVLDLEGQIKEAEAEESVLNMLSGSDHSFTNTADCQGDSGMKVSELNPLALEWVSGNLPPVSVPSVSVPVVSVPAVSGGVPVMDMLDLNLGVTALNGGAVSSVGVPGVGGAVSSVGVPGVGGAVSSVSVPGVGGAVSSVGVPGVGGAVSSVGVPGVGGAVSSVSVPGVGGAVSSVGVPGVGGAVSSVSVPGVGGAVSSVGVPGCGWRCVICGRAGCGWRCVICGRAGCGWRCVICGRAGCGWRCVICGRAGCGWRCVICGRAGCGWRCVICGRAACGHVNGEWPYAIC